MNINDTYNSLLYDSSFLDDCYICRKEDEIMTQIIEYFIGAFQPLFTYANSEWTTDPNLVLTFCIFCGVGSFIILTGLIAILKTCITACANAIRGL